MKRKLFVVFIMSLFSIGWLWGCAPNAPTVTHSAADITAIAVSCGEIDRSQSYSFWLHNEGEAWLLDASCFTQQKEVETELKDCAINDEEKNAVFAILEQNDSIAFVENYAQKQPVKNVADGSSYSFALTFTDGTQYVADKQQAELEAFFYDLTEKYATVVPSEQ